MVVHNYVNIKDYIFMTKDFFFIFENGGTVCMCLHSLYLHIKQQIKIFENER